jgi:predicted transposase YdaD
MAFDNLCKLLAEKYPDRFASWLLGSPQIAVEVLKTELSIEPIRADSVTFLQLQGRILHLEVQTKLESQSPLPLRMLDYWVRLYCHWSSGGWCLAMPKSWLG